jgi:hypothetical protein
MHGARKYYYLVVARLSGGRQVVSFILLFFKQFTHPCCNDIHIHLFTKMLGEKHGYNNDYENADVGIWLVDKEVNRWGIELMMETPHIEWCFQFKKWKDLDKIK